MNFEEACVIEHQNYNTNCNLNFKNVGSGKVLYYLIKFTYLFLGKFTHKNMQLQLHVLYIGNCLFICFLYNNVHN